MDFTSFPSPFLWREFPVVFSPRWGHTIVPINNSLVLFGGYCGQYLSDIWSFSLDTLIWTQIQVSNPPESRSHHSAVSYKQKMIVFGGKTKNNRVLSDLHEFDLITLRWKMVIAPNNNPLAVMGRSGHSADVLLNQYMVIFGGENIVDMDDLRLLDLSNYHWRKGNTYGKSPKARKFHGSCVVKEKLYIIGGCCDNYQCLGDIFMLDFKEYTKNGILQWEELQTGLPPRWGHSVACYGKEIFIFGGKNEKDLHDLYRFNTKKGEVKEITQQGVIPSARRRQIMITMGASMFLIGGFNGKYLGDMYYMSLLELELDLEFSNRDKNEAENLQKKQENVINSSTSQQENSQIDLICKDGKIFTLDYPLLVTKSGYFKAFFSQPFCESLPKTAEIHSIPSKTMSIIVEFLKNGNFLDEKPSEIEKIQLLKAAKFLIMEDLSLFVQSSMGKKLVKRTEDWENDEYMLGLYALAVDWNADFLKNAILAMLAIRIKGETKCFLEKMEAISKEHFPTNRKTIEEIRKKMRFWRKLREFGKYTNSSNFAL